MRSLRWADAGGAAAADEECEEWLLANPAGRHGAVVGRQPTAERHLSRLQAGRAARLGPRRPSRARRPTSPGGSSWTPQESRQLDGIGTHDEFVDLWEDVTGERATDLHWYLVFGAYRLAAIFAKLFSMMVAQGRMPPRRPARSSRPASRAAHVRTARSDAAARCPPARTGRASRALSGRAAVGARERAVEIVSLRRAA